MSSYRSYAPWKSTLGSTYKSGSSSAYSSRDDISTPRYTSLATPSTYRPSFSGGTYRIKRDPPPPTTVTPYVSRYASVSTKSDKDNSSEASPKTSQIKRYTSTNSNLGKYGSSREPSPAAIERTNRITSREHSPVARTLRGKSRDPSPVIDTKCKIGYGGANSYRMSTPRTATTPASTGYTSRYGAGSTSATRASSAAMPDKCISYLSASDFRARSISRAKEIATRKSSEKELKEDEVEQVDNAAQQTKIATEIKEESDTESPTEEEFVTVSVVTRATSPTPPGSTTVHRTRRIDIAKTIEKTIQRSTRKKEMLEKEIQSDRMDDSTRYSRFGMGSRVSSYSPHNEGRYSSNSPRFSSSPLATVSKSSASNSCSSTSEPKKEESPSSGKTTRSAASKSKLSPPKVVRINSRQSSVENLATTTTANKPPTAPKAESPTKSTSSSSNGAVRWPNKDFRKSALNVGPTDRPRKSRTPSSGTESDAVQQRQERSPSAGSEASNASASSSRRTGAAAAAAAAADTKTRQRCHAKPNSGTSSSLSRHNSSTNLKGGSHKSCTPPTSSASTSAISSSSSGTDSSGEHRKISKKNGKKKTINSHNKDATDNNNKSKQNNANSAGDSDELLSTKRSTSAENSHAEQPLSTNTDPRAASEAAQVAQQTKIRTDSSARAKSSKSTSSSHGRVVNPKEKTATTNRLQKLSSMSNFFVARQNDTNSEPIFLESSESSGDLDSNQLISSSLTEDFKTNASPVKHSIPTSSAATTTTTTTNSKAAASSSNDESTATVSTRNPYKNLDNTEEVNNLPHTQRSNDSTASKSKSITNSSSSKCPNETTKATETASPTELTSDFQTEASPTNFNTTTSSSEQEEPSWWQDTSCQVNTASALDFNHKDEMRYKLRHIDSGEAAWWLRNDEDDTLADDDLKTLNQEEDASEDTDAVQSLPTHSNSAERTQTKSKHSWWTSENNDDNEQNDNNEETRYENELNETNHSNTRSQEGAYNMPNDSESEKWAVQQASQSRFTPEKQWWAEGNNSNSDIGSANNSNVKQPAKQNGTIHVKVCRVESGDSPWWVTEEAEEEEQNGDYNTNVTVEASISLPPRSEHLERSASKSKNLDEASHWWLSGPKKKLFNVRRVESGEKAWWQQDESDEKKSMPQQSVRHCDSGEKAWWLQNDDDQKNGETIKHDDEGNGGGGDIGNAAACCIGDAEVQNLSQANRNNFGNRTNSNTELSNSFNFEYAERPPPLGQCASPVVDLELPLAPPPRYASSPYDNIPMSKVQQRQQMQLQLQHKHSNGNVNQQQPQQQQQQQCYYNNNNGSYNYNEQQRKPSRQKLFISRHQNIDELLGGSCRPLSPLFFDGSSFSPQLTGRNIFVEEITPDQVRIHDSTAQMPVIQRMERDDWDNGCRSSPAANNGTTASRYEHRAIDDASIQVYKEGDYGAYLDLESSLAEQAEEIEGLNSSRKNSLVVRTQLSVRVHAIIEKLLSAEGSDLRRALFSLKQVFQEDKDLVHAFVALGGLNCLVRVGNGADQNYQNYILRALGQVMLYVDGMNGVMKHEPTMQWLYSLIASNYRSVVKTALKLLLVFVEYAETNCYVLVNAIHAVDKSQATLPWSNIMRLLKDYDNADAELVIYATSLINKTLAGLNDQDSFYDESDLLEQQGMESVIQRYMSKPGTDLDLLDQLQLYEAVLKFEDGESDGIRLPDNSVRKTQRFRPGTDTTERRKSRRHSTGTSPSVINKVMQSPKRLTPTHGVLDEDSSGSTNSTEFSGGLFAEKKSRDPAGVTPGLRRRRERAERHKSFLKEQQEAAANGIFAALEKREEMGQIVTAIPATVNNTESPPESLNLTNETIANIINHTSTIINYPNITANATNNASTTNTAATNNINTLTHNNNSSSNNLMSPTKHLLGSNTISIINNSFDKAHNNNINNNVSTTNNNNKLQGTPEFLTKKNLLMEHNATVINGIMKNIQRGNESENHPNNTTTAYKKYESDANRLNNFYNQLSQTTPKNQNQLQNQIQAPNLNPSQNPILNQSQTIQTAQSALASVLSPKKNLNGFDFTQTTSFSTTPSTPSTPSTPIKSSLTSSEPQTPSTETRTAEASFTSSTPSSSPTKTTSALIPEVANYSTLNSIQYTTKAAATPPPPPPPPPDWGWSFSPLVNPTNTLLANASSSCSNELKDDLLQITESDSEDRKMLQQLKRDHTVKDLTQKLSNIPTSPTQEDKLQNRIVGDMTGLISKAKEGLAKSKSKGEMSRSSSVDQEIKKSEQKKSENELHWEELVRNMSRSLNLCDLDFTDLNSDDEKDMLATRSIGGGVPPPPPPFGGVPPPMLQSHIVCPPPINGSLLPPPMFSYSGYGNSSLTNSVNSSLNGSLNGDIGSSNTIKKNKKTVKLFWKEVREDLIPVVVGKTIWDELPAANVDTQKLEHLFESRAKDLIIKKTQDMNKSKEIIILDHKRSNAINIAMTKLPPPRAIKAAILKMDATVVTREGIDKLLNMLPTDEERGKIQEAQMANPELPLGSAEQFLLTLASISELGARLKLWAFRLDFDNSEKEIAEPLMDLKQGIEILRKNRTFKCILSTLLSVGIFLNGAPVKGFQIEYLAKVPEVKDTVHKHSLLHHLCHIVMESCSDTTDLYSEIGPITRASKADYTDLAHNLSQMESECKGSWDRLKLIAKHDCPPQLKQKLVDFLADCAERIIILQIVHRRVINRYRKFLLWLGVPQHSVAESRPNEFCRIVSEFALEYRTTRERVQQQIEKKANHRERNKTRGKMIIDIAKFKTKEDHADAQLKELLGTPSADTADGTLTWRRRRAENLRSPIARQSEENFTDGDDEILESLVKTATKAPGTRTTPRERKRTRHADRKSLRRTLKNGLTEEEKQHVAALIKTY